MQTFNTYFESEATFKEFVERNSLEKSDNILVQVFTSELTKEGIAAIRDAIVSTLPQASLIGATTDGEINGSEVTTDKTVVSITHFDSSQVEVFSLNNATDSFVLGRDLAHKALTPASKVMILFSDGLHTNGEELLLGVNSIHSEVVIAGGMAADAAKFEATYVFTQSEILEQGAVCAVLESPTLNVFTNYSCNWEKIGQAMRVTKAEANRVYTIDNHEAVSVYRHYLGESAAASLPAVGIEFPLIITRDGVDIARAVLAKDDDGSLTFAGNIAEGDEVYFGFGNVETILDASSEFEKVLEKEPVESLFIYSCMARRRFLQEEIVNEIAPLNTLASTSGFFTYGEFFKSKNVELLNQTMTILALSESSEVRTHTENQEKKRGHSEVVETQKALTHLIQVTSNELKDVNENLERMVAQKTKELEKTIENLQEATKVKSQFLANMSHEFRTPLNSIMGFTQILEKELITNEKKKKLQVIKNAGKSLLNIIDDILDFTQLENGKLEVEIAAFDIKNLLEELKYSFEQEAKNKNIKLELNVQLDFQDELKSDAKRVQQILQNFLSNAFKFTQKNGAISIEAHCKDDKELRISVEDSGCGISQKVIKSIFRSFTQADNSITRQFGGSGLGLTVSNELSHLLNGRIDVESQVGEGSKFTLILPCEREKSEVMSEEQEAFKGHILVVEDNKSNQMLMELLLEDLGLTCDIAEDGLEGVEAFKKGKYDLIFMDENMPNLSGSEAAKIIFDIEKEEGRKHTPMSAFTANALPGDRERFLELGMDDYMSKPVDMDILESILRKYL